MSTAFRQGPAAKPIAVVIAAKMRAAMPKTVQPHAHAPVNVKHALKNAANSSPAAKAAFQRAAPAVKAATPHLKALTQPGKGLLSSLRHGVSAMHSLRQVTREMAREAPPAMPSTLHSAASAFKAASESSPAAAAAFKRAGPAAANAQGHVAALGRMQEAPKPGLLSSLGHGIQAMRALRQVTKGLREQPGMPPLVPGEASKDGQEKARPGLLSSFGQGVQMLHALHGAAKGLAREGTDAPTFAGSGDAHGADSSPFALMLIARRNSRTLSMFKDRT